MIRPGEEIHYVALLNEGGDTLVTVPMRTPVACPERAFEVSVSVDLDLKLRGRGKRVEASRG